MKRLNASLKGLKTNLSAFCNLQSKKIRLATQLFLFSSFLQPNVSGLKPTTAVSLISAVFVAASSTFVTTCVEQSLWAKLAPRAVKNPLTVGETRRLAQWAVSPLGRLSYPLDGTSILLKLAGPLLLACAIVNSVLVSGISVSTHSSSVDTTSQATVDMWSGFLDAANFQYNGGLFSDIPNEVAALAYLNNLSVPSSSLCQSSDCSLGAQVGAIQAECITVSAPHGPMSSTDEENETYTSEYNPDIAVILTRGSPYTYANFTSWFTKSCGENVNVNLCLGEFAVIFGAFVNLMPSATGGPIVNTIDCLLTYGSLNITQTGTGTPAIMAGSYTEATSAGPNDSSIASIKRIYTDSFDRSPYYFTAKSGTEDTTDTLYNSAVATLLISPKGNSSDKEVGDRIEAIFNTATLMAFTRVPGAANVTTTTTTSGPIYVFHPLVLLILLIPLFSTVLGGYRRLRVEGNSLCPGYDPVEIARRGSVEGISDWNGDNLAGIDTVDDRKVRMLTKRYGDQRTYGLNVL
ncbi:unnamed protein product [Clonostachys solani]|uniref:Uncharacterized protein n=1 Tax=Clonostachys solani TaxID=160281 RepID=A0A9N9ZKF0_9HYPO|nr:unnamed protein product [Clonostachys solani]